MHPLLRKRALFSGCGFSLLEMLITMAVIGIILALLTPKINDIREESLRQTARQQTKIFEQALSQWYNAQSSVFVANNIWNNQFDGATGYANATELVAAISPYLTLQNAPTTTSTSCYTNEMAKLTDKGYGFITETGTTPDSSLDCAHIRFFWDTDRTSYAPKIVFFLPALE